MNSTAVYFDCFYWALCDFLWFVSHSVAKIRMFLAFRHSIYWSSSSHTILFWNEYESIEMSYQLSIKILIYLSLCKCLTKHMALHFRTCSSASAMEKFRLHTYEPNASTPREGAIEMGGEWSSQWMMHSNKWSTNLLPKSYWFNHQ